MSGLSMPLYSFSAKLDTLSTPAGMEITNVCGFRAQMNSATTVGNSVKISTPTLSWERIGANVNEGPAALYHGGRTFIVYSASNCAGTGYSLGRLELTGSNPLSASSWTKYGSPIFTGANGNNEVRAGPS
uniref:Putative Arabinanase/levansucrase/invertase n=1 Tax=Moniliophthora roreri TaxID=221103 RepID=A0A0W0GDE0_MONRR